MKAEIIRLIQNEINAADDNLYRAQLALNHPKTDPNAEWGQSGRTLAEIVAGYKETKQKYEQLLREYKGVPNE